MKCKYKEMKQAVKDLAEKIKKHRLKWGYKDDSSSYQFRHLHIAYCLYRGRSMEQIENKVHEGNEHNPLLVKKYTDQYAWEDEHEEAICACA